MPDEYLSLLQSLPSTVEEIKQPATGIATVDVGVETGPPQHLTSGILYGIPDLPDQIPDHFYKDIGYNYGRGGGSQLLDTVGFERSFEDYKARFSSARSNYRTARKHEGEFIYLLPALWGVDGGQSVNFEYPGDEDDWGIWDAFLKLTLEDVRENDMMAGLVIDIWNEPDLNFFWDRPKEQWLSLWPRTYLKIREVLPSTRITGPSMSAIPSPRNDWWTSFMSRVIQEPQTFPDQWSWHMEGGEESTDMAKATSSFRSLLSSFGIRPGPVLDININEYGVYGEQLPSAGAWWIAGLERENAHGLRGNWAMSGALHDFLAGFLSKPGAGTGNYATEGGEYWPAAEYQVYNYYASVMEGQRLRTTPTPDALMDVYATVGRGVVRALAGTRSRPGDWAIDIVGLADLKRVKVKILAFGIPDGDRFKQADGPENLGETEQVVREGRLRVRMQHDDPATAFAF